MREFTAVHLRTLVLRGRCQKKEKRKAKTEMVGFVSSVAIMITTECHSQRNKENEAKGTRSHYDRTHALA